MPLSRKRYTSRKQARAFIIRWQGGSRGKETPSLLITARRDRLVSPGNSRRMAAKIHAYGGVVAERTYGGVGHLTLIGAFAPGLRVLAPVLRDVTQFVWRVTRRQADFCEVT